MAKLELRDVVTSEKPLPMNALVASFRSKQEASKYLAIFCIAITKHFSLRQGVSVVPIANRCHVSDKLLRTGVQAVCARTLWRFMCKIGSLLGRIPCHCLNLSAPSVVPASNTRCLISNAAGGPRWHRHVPTLPSRRHVIPAVVFVRSGAPVDLRSNSLRRDRAHNKQPDADRRLVPHAFRLHLDGGRPGRGAHEQAAGARVDQTVALEAALLQHFRLGSV